MERVIGIETEYATVWHGEGGPPSRQTIFEALAAGVLAQLDAEVSVDTSSFLPNGGRLYFDDETQPPGSGLVEWSTPECRTVTEAVLYDLAGQQLLARSIPFAEDELGGRLILLKNNRDGAGHTYGCHENYLVLRQSEFFSDEKAYFRYLVRCLTPFLVTRQVLCAAGQTGLYRYAETNRAGYQLSQRADFVTDVVHADARRRRPIINTRDEPHADRQKYRRLHVLVGDSNMSPWCTFVKLGTTHLVLSMAEALAADVDYVLSQPILALRSISYNGCHIAVRMLERGREVKRTALDIQRDYLAMVEDYFADASMQSETRFIIEEWKEALEYLARDPSSLGNRVDWITKLMLLLEERELTRASWDSSYLAEIDLRYHDINPQTGIYSELLEEGISYGRLTERFNDPMMAKAMRTPPTTTRARIRGEYVDWCRNQKIAPKVDWNAVVLGEQTIVLGDPLAFFSEPISRVCVTLADSLAFLQQQLRENESRDVRIRAVQALGRLPLTAEERSIALADGLDDPDWRVRVQTVEILVALKPVPLALLRQACEDQHVAVRRRALAALQ
jgi:proteasome accessory factor A